VLVPGPHILNGAIDLARTRIALGIARLAYAGVIVIAAGMLAHAARWALISVKGTNAATGALAACMLVSVLVTPIADRLHLPFAALAFSAVVSLMPGFFLFNAATGVVELVSIEPNAPAALLTSIAANGATAFSDHHGHDLRADPSAHAVRARIARACMKCGMDVLCTAPPFKISPKRRCIRC
jgi:uncharacterized membrane protein YjjP (DUF1212 family)